VTKRIDLPDKLYFKIGEVAQIADVKPHVLRYWESEFSSIRPHKSRAGQRLYRQKDVEAVLAIRHLLYEQRFTIEGARAHLAEHGVEEALPPPDPEAIADAARRETERELKDEAARAKAGAVRFYEERLLALQTDAKRFLAALAKGDPSGSGGEA
jgi:DNA-binding transcriptional MerR regulator